MSKTFISLPDRFDSCSVPELVQCILFRRDELREIRAFLNDPNSRQYPTIRAKLRLNKFVIKNEVHRINQSRHLLLATECKNLQIYRLDQE